MAQRARRLIADRKRRAHLGRSSLMGATVECGILLLPRRPIDLIAQKRCASCFPLSLIANGIRSHLLAPPAIIDGLLPLTHTDDAGAVEGVAQRGSCHPVTPQLSAQLSARDDGQVAGSNPAGLTIQSHRIRSIGPDRADPPA